MTSPGAEEVVWWLEMETNWVDIGVRLKEVSPIPTPIAAFYHSGVLPFQGYKLTAKYSVYFLDEAGERAALVTNCDKDFYDFKPVPNERISIAEYKSAAAKAQREDGSLTLVSEISFTRPITRHEDRFQQILCSQMVSTCSCQCL